MMLGLTEKQSETIELFKQGWTQQEIADMHFVSQAAIKSRVLKIYERLKVHNAFQLGYIVGRSENGNEL